MSRKSRTQTHSAQHSSQFAGEGAANPRIHGAEISKYLAYCFRITERIKGLLKKKGEPAMTVNTTNIAASCLTHIECEYGKGGFTTESFINNTSPAQTDMELQQKHWEVISARRATFSLTDVGGCWARSSALHAALLGNRNVGCIHTLACTERQRRIRRAAALILITAPVSLIGENNGCVRLWNLQQKATSPINSAPNSASRRML